MNYTAESSYCTQYHLYHSVNISPWTPASIGFKGNVSRDFGLCGRVTAHFINIFMLNLDLRKLMVRWTLSLRRVYCSKDQLQLKIRGQYCSDRLFSGHYCTSGASQRYGTSPLDCLSHQHSTPHMRSTGQMKIRWET